MKEIIVPVGTLLQMYMKCYNLVDFLTEYPEAQSECFQYIQKLDNSGVPGEHVIELLFRNPLCVPYMLEHLDTIDHKRMWNRICKEDLDLEQGKKVVHKLAEVFENPPNDFLCSLLRNNSEPLAFFDYLLSLNFSEATINYVIEYVVENVSVEASEEERGWRLEIIKRLRPRFYTLYNLRVEALINRELFPSEGVREFLPLIVKPVNKEKKEKIELISHALKCLEVNEDTIIAVRREARKFNGLYEKTVHITQTLLLLVMWLANVAKAPGVKKTLLTRLNFGTDQAVKNEMQQLLSNISDV